MVNNYEKLLEYSKLIHYDQYNVLIRYISRKKDKINNTINVKHIYKFSVYENIHVLNMNELTEFCNKNKCRCYLSFINKYLKTFINMMFGSLEMFNYFTHNINDNLKQLLLMIDMDDLSVLDRTIKYLEHSGCEKYCEIPSKTGVSLLFKGNSVMLKQYNNEFIDVSNVNTIHYFPSVNLYIPDFE